MQTIQTKKWSLLMLVVILLLENCSKATSGISGYKCISGICSYVDTGATYTTKGACDSACAVKNTSGYNCVSGACTYVASGANFATLNDCQAACTTNVNTVRDIDSNVYQIVKIGDQTWMASNLKTTRYNNGTSIQNVKDPIMWSNLGTGAWCIYDTAAANNTLYGKLYNWYAVNSTNLCPTGWHVPTDAEWTTLSSYLGGESAAGGKMKSTSGWNAPNVGATNESGFNALPGGLRFLNGNFNAISVYGIWWSATEVDASNAWSRGLDYNNANLVRSSGIKKSGSSVRCIKD